MVAVGFLIGFVDFKSSLDISQVAQLLSSRLFGGIPFVEKDADHEDYLGTLRLAHHFLGVQVNLIGKDDRYTIEMQTVPSGSSLVVDEVGDLSAILKNGIETLGGSELVLKPDSEIW